MNIRLMGTKGECAVAAELIAQTLTVVEVSEPRENRGASALVRVYLEVRIPDGPAGAERPGSAVVADPGRRSRDRRQIGS